MKCAGCNKEATYMVHDSYDPHCDSCFAEAVEGCTEMTKVMTVAGWKEKMKRERENQVA